MTEATTQLAPGQHGPTVEAVAQLLLGALNANDVPHGVAMDALLTLYRGLALKFACCTPTAALATSALSGELLSRIAQASQQAGNTTTTH